VCIFCGRAKGDLVDPRNPNSRRLGMSEEHLFRKSWQEKIVTSDIPRDDPAFKRTFTKIGHDGSIQVNKRELLFEVVIKNVCGECNSSWLNRLDDAVEPWILNPYEDKLKPDPHQFRLWAIKTAVLRCYYHNKLIPQPEDIQAIYDREDIPEWHIFVGHMADPDHTHTQVGYGPVSLEGGGLLFGVTQVSWSLGRIMVTAIRPVRGDDTVPIRMRDMSTNYLNRFRQDNISEGVVVAEVRPGARRCPSLALLPKMAFRGYMSLAWYFSSHRLSPIAHEMRDLNAELRRLAIETGQPSGSL
jgi:hypothetical protein